MRKMMSLKEDIEEVCREYKDYSLDDLFEKVDKLTNRLTALRNEEDDVMIELIELQAVIVVRGLDEDK